MMFSATRLIARARLVAAFASSGLPRQWPRLASLGVARGNPSGWLAGRMGAVRVSPRALGGRTVVVDATDLGHLVSFEEVFVAKTYDLSRVPFQPRVIVDCGAHAGFFAALAAATFPGTPVVAFEPNPRNAAWLRKNLEPDADRATVHEAAASTADGAGHFAAPESNTGRLAADGMPIRVVDLKSRIPPLPDMLLKIDVEGEEARLVPHLLPALSSRCALFIETHHGPQARRQLSTLLAEAGFAVTQVRERDPFADLFALRDAA